MKQFTYEIQDQLGIHARPAGQLVKLAKSFGDTQSTIEVKGKGTSSLTQLMKLMALGVKYNDEVIVRVEGGNEEAAAEALENFFKERL